MNTVKQVAEVAVKDLTGAEVHVTIFQNEGGALIGVDSSFVETENPIYCPIEGEEVDIVDDGQPMPTQGIKVFPVSWSYKGIPNLKVFHDEGKLYHAIWSSTTQDIADAQEEGEELEEEVVEFFENLPNKGNVLDAHNIMDMYDSQDFHGKQEIHIGSPNLITF